MTSVDTGREQVVAIASINTERLTRKAVIDTDLRALAASMALEGLRHPVLLMPNGELLKGGRRLTAAFELLGWETIPARRVRYADDAVDSIVDSRDEFSVKRTWEERVMLGLTLETLDHKPAENGEYLDYTGVIACALATSGSGYKRARIVVTAAQSRVRPAHVVAVAKHALDAVNAGTMSLTAAVNRVKAAEKGVDLTEKEDQVGGISTDALPRLAPPSAAARSPKARQLREQWIRAMSAQGATTPQIAQRLGLTPQGIRSICRQTGIEIPADQVVSRMQGKAANPNKVVRVAVEDLDALVESLARVDVSALDTDALDEWSQRLARYSRQLARIARTIKGVAQ